MVSKLDLKLKEFKDLLNTNNNFKQCLKNYLSFYEKRNVLKTLK